jgi:hypothetical protein
MAYRFDQYDNSIVIDGWENGIADSPYGGLSNIRCVNITSIPGEACVNFSTRSVKPTATTGGVINSADATANTLTSHSAIVANGQAITITGSNLPDPLVTGTVYWVTNVTNGGLTFQVCLNAYLVPIDLTTSGTPTWAFTGSHMGIPMQRTYDKTDDYYFILDSNGKAWMYNSGIWKDLNNSVSNNHANGIIYYRGYLFVFRDHYIDYAPISTLVWTNNWQTLNTLVGQNNSHYAYIGQDDVVYYCDASFVGSFFQKPGQTFDPSNAATYTWTATALALPSTDTAQTLAELGVNLLVGGQLNAIYPWDRISTSFSYPILIGETFISRIVTVNTNSYIFAGQRGRIYISNGSQAQLYKKIPDHISGTVEPFYVWGDACCIKNQLYFGIKASRNDTDVAIPEYGGIWAIDLDTKAMRLAMQLTFATYGCLVTMILPLYIQLATFTTLFSGLGMFAGYDDGSNGNGLDVTSGTPYTGSQATIDTDLIPIGTYDKPRNLCRVEYKLSEPLVSGESIIINYRLLFDKTDASSGLGQYQQLFTDSTVGNYSSSGPVNFKNAQWVQFQIVLNSTATTPSYVRLRQIRINGLAGQPLNS